MFDIIRADPKNRPLLREVDKAERELTAFLYDEPDDAAKERQVRYGAELTQIAHNALTFQCGSLSEKEAEEIIEQASRLHGEIVDCRPEELVSYMAKEHRFTLWWD